MAYPNPNPHHPYFAEADFTNAAPTPQSRSSLSSTGTSSSNISTMAGSGGSSHRYSFHSSPSPSSTTASSPPTASPYMSQASLSSSTLSSPLMQHQSLALTDPAYANIENVARLFLEVQSLRDEISGNQQALQALTSPQSQVQSPSQSLFESPSSSQLSPFSDFSMMRSSTRRSSMPNTAMLASLSQSPRSSQLHTQSLSLSESLHRYQQSPTRELTRSVPARQHIPPQPIQPSPTIFHCALLQELLVPPPWSTADEWPHILMRSPTMRDLLTKLWMGGTDYEAYLSDWAPTFLSMAYAEVTQHRMGDNDSEAFEACIVGADIVRRRLPSESQSLSLTQTQSLASLDELNPIDTSNSANSLNTATNMFSSFSSQSLFPPVSLSASAASMLPFLPQFGSAPVLSRTASSPPINYSNAFERRKQKRRRSEELAENERWHCPNSGCWRFYRRSSTSSIRGHKANCPFAPHNQTKTSDDNESQASAIETATVASTQSMPMPSVSTSMTASIMVHSASSSSLPSAQSFAPPPPPASSSVGPNHGHASFTSRRF